jgi:putative hemolysin
MKAALSVKSKLRTSWFGAIFLAGCSLVLIACALSTGPETDAGEPSAIGGANPASVACVKAGGQLEIRTLPDRSQIGMCHTRDGRICEEWALYHNGVCRPE